MSRWSSTHFINNNSIHAGIIMMSFQSDPWCWSGATCPRNYFWNSSFTGKKIATDWNECLIYTPKSNFTVSLISAKKLLHKNQPCYDTTRHTTTLRGTRGPFRRCSSHSLRGQGWIVFSNIPLCRIKFLCCLSCRLGISLCLFSEDSSQIFIDSFKRKMINIIATVAFLVAEQPL